MTLAKRTEATSIGSSDLAARVAASSYPEPNSGCWLWTLSLNRTGYGLMMFRGVRISAHRASVVASGRAIPEGMHVDHLCRNPSCVNPDHLEPVTPRENTIRGVHGKNIRAGKCTKCGSQDGQYVMRKRGGCESLRGEWVCQPCTRAKWRKTSTTYRLKRQANG